MSCRQRTSWPCLQHMKERRLSVDIHRRLPSFNLDLNLEVEQEVLVLFGPSGSGKTMTLESIAGLVSPDEGEIVLDGQVLFRQGLAGEHVNLPARKRRMAGVGSLHVTDNLPVLRDHCLDAPQVGFIILYYFRAGPPGVLEPFNL